MKHICLSLAAAIVVAVTGCTKPDASPRETQKLLSRAADRPNIVLCMADDQGWGDIGYAGHPVLKTPHLNAMAEAGLRFNRFYAAAPVCSPTRGSCEAARCSYSLARRRWR